MNQKGVNSVFLIYSNYCFPTTVNILPRKLRRLPTVACQDPSWLAPRRHGSHSGNNGNSQDWLCSESWRATRMPLKQPPMRWSEAKSAIVDAFKFWLTGVNLQAKQFQTKNSFVLFLFVVEKTYSQSFLDLRRNHLGTGWDTPLKPFPPRSLWN